MQPIKVKRFSIQHVIIQSITTLLVRLFIEKKDALNVALKLCEMRHILSNPGNEKSP